MTNLTVSISILAALAGNVYADNAKTTCSTVQSQVTNGTCKNIKGSGKCIDIKTCKIIDTIWTPQYDKPVVKPTQKPVAPTTTKLPPVVVEEEVYGAVPFWTLFGASALLINYDNNNGDDYTSPSDSPVSPE